MQVAQNSEARPLTVDARCVRLNAKADNADALAPAVERRQLARAANEVLIEIKAAAVNPSDVKAATGLMPYAVFPRTPGRDYAGVIIDGPADSIGREVFGSSGDLGIRRDGTPCDASCRRARGDRREAEKHFMGRGGRDRRALCHGDGRFSPRRHPESRRDRAGHGRQRQGRPGRGADRDLAWRARDRRGAQEGAL